ncbi:Hypothetical predicted protein [Lecanosticta acicola]|uniref:Uncharacterized protein n=1 Tax=Lecanosticta acicola TaxID=111012 RepID=A0AAI9E886_9PEZI|nr:Hypothetical predicted protein [Lecanosticta acicola]
MFAKLATVFTLLALSAHVAVATPPACLIAAVNTQDDPSDLKSVCGDGASVVKKYISSNCGDSQDAANSAFMDVCKDAGVTVSSSASSSGTATKSATKSASSSASVSSASVTESASKGVTSGIATNIPNGTLTGGYAPIGTGASSGFMSQTANGTYSAPTASATGTSRYGSSAATPTESGISTSTGAASRLGMDLLGLTAVGVFGAMLAL